MSNNLLLYSTNVFLKHIIQEKYRNNLHYVWCSEGFDSKTLSLYSQGRQVPASSNPADIYHQLMKDVKSHDKHSPKIIEQKANFKTLAIKWEQKGEITSNDKEEIIYITETADFEYWRPLLYLIPRAPLANRIITVPMQRCAGLGNEYIIEDLQKSEFDIVELPC